MRRGRGSGGAENTKKLETGIEVETLLEILKSLQKKNKLKARPEGIKNN